MEDELFKVLSEPARRKIIELLAESGTGQSIQEIAERFRISRQAVTKHIQKLESVQLVELEKRGREQMCTANLENLKSPMEWINKYYSFWQDRLGALEKLLDSSP